ncbi:MAG TPA: DUF167 domain-containing protein [Pyrinomonadaceae bacterium]|jgi:hypothetical protein
MLEATESGGALTFRVRVAPRASKTAAAGVDGGALKVRVAAPPVEGAANEELARFLSKAFGVPARAVEIISGHASKTKTLRVAGANREDLLRLAGENKS